MQPSKPSRKRQWRAILAVFLAAPFVYADSWDKYTVVTFSIPVTVSSIQLTPGSYTFSVFDSPSDRTLIQIRNSDTNEFLGWIRAIPTKRTEVASNSIFILGEAPVGRPVPLLKWFYPGEELGYEFVEPERSYGLPVPRPVGLIYRSAIPDVQQSTNKWALIVGVSEFADSRINLNYAGDDARSLASVLADPTVGRFMNDGTHLRVLTDAQATASNFRSSLSELTARVGAKDLVVIFVSTHGFGLRRWPSDAGNLALAMHDMDLGRPEQTAISLEELAVMSSRLPAANVVLMLDVCMDGVNAAGAKDLAVVSTTRTLEFPAFGRGRVVIASSRPNESSWESNRFRSGFFTHFLIQALIDSGGSANMARVYEELNRLVPPAVLAERGEQQHPIMVSSDDSTRGIVLGARPQ